MSDPSALRPTDTRPLADRLRIEAMRASGPRVRVVSVGGVRLLLDARDEDDAALMAGIDPAAPAYEAMRTTLEGEAFDIMLDIGAGAGRAAVLAAQAGVPTVYAFEPLTRATQAISGALFANHLVDGVIVQPLALGDGGGEVELRVDPRRLGRTHIGAILPPAEEAAFTHVELASYARLDQVLRERGLRAYVRIDVEGHEGAVIAGAGAFLEHNFVDLEIVCSGRDESAWRDRLFRLAYAERDAIGRSARFGNVALVGDLGADPAIARRARPIDRGEAS